MHSLELFTCCCCTCWGLCSYVHCGYILCLYQSSANMLFRFSVDDFIAAAMLVKNVISTLKGAAILEYLEYRELELGLHGSQLE